MFYVWGIMYSHSLFIRCWVPKAWDFYNTIFTRRDFSHIKGCFTHFLRYFAPPGRICLKCDGISETCRETGDWWVIDNTPTVNTFITSNSYTWAEPEREPRWLVFNCISSSNRIVRWLLYEYLDDKFELRITKDGEMRTDFHYNWDWQWNSN